LWDIFSLIANRSSPYFISIIRVSIRNRVVRIEKLMRESIDWGDPKTEPSGFALLNLLTD
jgi:hypothetical protein